MMIRAPSFALVAVAVLGMSASAAAQQYPEVVFVFDASGSMLEAAGSVTKIEAAKKVMHEIVPQLDNDVRVGLVAYGHRRKGDCSDIEVLIPPGSQDREELLARIDAIQPRGLTPISDAVTVAVELLKLKENETTVVLVSDGKETCAADPCAVVTALKATGIRFVLHVVGFQVDAEAKGQLECFAQAGGGRYFHANDAAGLLNAMQAIDREIDQKVEQARTTSVARGTGLGRIELTVPETAVRTIAGIEIVRVKDEKVLKRTDGITPSSRHPLPDGEYDVYCLFAQPNYGKPFRATLARVTVTRGHATRIEMGAIAFNIAQSLADGTALDEVRIVTRGNQQPVAVAEDRNNGAFNFVPKAVLPGVYDVQFRYANSPSYTTVAQGIAVSAGRISYVTLDSGLRLKQANGSDVTGWDLVPISLDIPSAGESSEETANSQSPTIQARPPFGNTSTLWMPFIVPPGSYNLLIHLKGMDEPLPAAEGLEVKPGQLIEFDAGL